MSAQDVAGQLRGLKLGGTVNVGGTTAGPTPPPPSVNQSAQVPVAPARGKQQQQRTGPPNYATAQQPSVGTVPAGFAPQPGPSVGAPPHVMPLPFNQAPAPAQLRIGRQPVGQQQVPLAVHGQPFMVFPGTVLGSLPSSAAAQPVFPGSHLQLGAQQPHHQYQQQVQHQAPPPMPPGIHIPATIVQAAGAPLLQQQQSGGRGGVGGRGRGRGSGGDFQRGRGGYGAGDDKSRRERPPRPAVKPFEENDESGEDTPLVEGSPTAAVHGFTPTAPEAPVGQRPEVDVELTKQLLARYEEQEVNSDSGMLKPPGLLNADEALSIIEANDVTFIVTDTGTGKSTLLPKMLMERGNKVVSSQPRRTATVNLAVRVASLRGETLGPNVGYLVRGDHIGDENTRLMYMTSYTLFLYIVSHPDDLGYTHFIIDEFHERQPDVEVMLALLKLARLKTNQKFKIILMSASAEVHEWKDYFEGLSVGVYSTCKPRYPVYEYYQEEVCRLIGAAYTPSPVTPAVGSLTLKNALFLVERMLEFLAKHAEPQHSVLVFLPGRTVVEQMVKFVQTKLGTQMEAVAWYRDVELERIDAAIKRRHDTRKKVYLATDIAEVSITLPDVVFVIDSGTTKKPRIDPNVRNSVVFPPLELLWTSKSAVAQRKGRIGRVQQGFYFGLMPETHLPLLVDMEPQIANSRIDELSLHILQIAANPLAVFNLCFHNTKRVCVQLSTNILVDNGCALPINHPRAEDEAVEHPDSAPWRGPVMADKRNEELRGAAFVTTVKGKIAQRLPSPSTARSSSRTASY
jgi:hypothetical protein